MKSLRIKWLKTGDSNTRFFHGLAMEEESETISTPRYGRLSMKERENRFLQIIVFEVNREKLDFC